MNNTLKNEDVGVFRNFFNILIEGTVLKLNKTLMNV